MKTLELFEHFEETDNKKEIWTDVYFIGNYIVKDIRRKYSDGQVLKQISVSARCDISSSEYQFIPEIDTDYNNKGKPEKFTIRTSEHSRLDINDINQIIKYCKEAIEVVEVLQKHFL